MADVFAALSGRLVRSGLWIQRLGSARRVTVDVDKLLGVLGDDLRWLQRWTGWTSAKIQHLLIIPIVPARVSYLSHTEDEFHGRMKIVQQLIECLQHTESFHGSCLVVFIFGMSTNQVRRLERNEKKFCVKTRKYLQRLGKISKISISLAKMQL